MELWHYLKPSGVDPFQAWLDALQDLAGRQVILRRTQGKDIEMAVRHWRDYRWRTGN
jgi:hypothetical protein